MTSTYDQPALRRAGAGSIAVFAVSVFLAVTFGVLELGPAVLGTVGAVGTFTAAVSAVLCLSELRIRRSSGR